MKCDIFYETSKAIKLTHHPVKVNTSPVGVRFQEWVVFLEGKGWKVLIHLRKEIQVITPLRETALKLSLACPVDNIGNPRTTEVLIDERLTECNVSFRTLKYFEE